MKYFFLLFFALNAFTQGQVVSDADQASFPGNNLLVDPENAASVDDAKSNYDEAAKGKDALNDGKLSSDEIAGLAIKYKTSRSGVIRMIDKWANKITSVIKKVSKRVDRWRTTLPRLKQMGKNMERFHNSNVQFLKTFEVSDLWDIDREFSRNFDNRIKGYAYIGFGVRSWLRRRYNSDVGVLKEMEGTWFPDDFELWYSNPFFKQNTSGFLERMNETGFNRIPHLTLETSVASLDMVNQIMDEQHGCTSSNHDDGSCITRRQRLNKRLELALTNPQSSYDAQVALSAMIDAERLGIAFHRQTIEHQRANVENMWARLQTRFPEMRLLYKSEVARSYKKLRGETKSIKDNREIKFGESKL